MTLAEDGIFVLGSTGAAGELLVRRLLAAGRRVVVLHRSDARRQEFEAWGATVVHGDATNRAEMQAAAQEAARDCGVMVSYIGGWPTNDPTTWPDYSGNRNAIDAAVDAGIPRFIFVTSIGTGNSFRYVPESSITRPILQLKTQAEEYLRQSTLCWTIIKPGGLGRPGTVPRTFTPLLCENESVRGSIDREDLTDLIVRVIDDQRGATFGKSLHAVATRIRVLEGELNPFVIPA